MCECLGGEDEFLDGRDGHIAGPGRYHLEACRYVATTRKNHPGDALEYTVKV